MLTAVYVYLPYARFTYYPLYSTHSVALHTLHAWSVVKTKNVSTEYAVQYTFPIIVVLMRVICTNSNSGKYNTTFRVLFKLTYTLKKPFHTIQWLLVVHTTKKTMYYVRYSTIGECAHSSYIIIVTVFGIAFCQFCSVCYMTILRSQLGKVYGVTYTPIYASYVFTSVVVYYQLTYI